MVLSGKLYRFGLSVNYRQLPWEHKKRGLFFSAPLFKIRAIRNVVLLDALILKLVLSKQLC